MDNCQRSTWIYCHVVSTCRTLTSNGSSSVAVKNSGAEFGKVLRTGAVYVAATVRLVVCPLLAIAALYPFRAALDRNMMLAMVIAASAPVAAMVSMFATKFNRDVDASVSVVSGTTLLSILTMPIVIALAMGVL